MRSQIYTRSAHGHNEIRQGEGKGQRRSSPRPRVTQGGTEGRRKENEDRPHQPADRAQDVSTDLTRE